MDGDIQKFRTEVSTTLHELQEKNDFEYQRMRDNDKEKKRLEELELQVKENIVRKYKLDKEFEKIEQENRKKFEDMVKDFKPEPIKKIITEQFAPYTYLVENLIPATGLTIISSAPKAGKSWLLLYLMTKLGTGEDFLNLKTQKSKMLLIDEENSRKGLQRRLKKITSQTDLPLEIMSQKLFKIDVELHRHWLINYIQENYICVLVFDSFRRLHTMNEDSSGDSAQLYEYFKEVMVSTGVPIIMTHHNRKMQQFGKINIESLRGSIDISAMAEALIVLDSKPLADADGNEVKVYPVLRESSTLKPFKYRMFDNDTGNHVIFEYSGEVIEGQASLEKAKEFIKQSLTDMGETTIKDLLAEKTAKKLPFGKNTLRQACKDLEEAGVLDSHTGQNKQWNTKFYFLCK